MKHYAVIGGGDGNKRVIVSSLNDLPADSVFHVRWPGEPSPAEEVVLDWLIDNEKSFVVYGQRVPKGLARHAEDTKEGDLGDMLAAVSGIGGTTGLVLWDDSAESQVIFAASILPHLLELTNGLTPIDVEDEEPAPAPAPVVNDEEETSSAFTREELENMPAAAVKRQAKERGLEINGLVKSEVIDLLLNETAPESTPTPDTNSEVLALAKRAREIDKQILDLMKEREKTIKEIGHILGFDL